jgi:HAD superfamily hydrolase (TIGR01549 family)
MIKVVAFDCDGVMFDSAGANQAYYNQILHHFDLPQMRCDQIAYVHMHTVHESLSFLLGDPMLITAAEAYRRQMDAMRFIRLMTIEPHLRTLLAVLRPERKTAIATNRIDTMDRVLSEHQLDDGFDLVVTAADVVHAKPHPDQLFKIMDHFSIPADEMIYIGDSDLDAVAAEKAKVPFIAYNNPKLTAGWHIDRLSQVLDILEA